MTAEELYSHSLFDLQRYLVACFFIGAGALLLASKVYGSIFSVLVLSFNVLYRCNPWIFTDEADQKEAWVLFVKTLAVIGGSLFLMTRGKLRNE